jgi:hypothetical protein
LDYSRRSAPDFQIPEFMQQSGLLYQIVEQHYPAFVAHMAQQERHLPDYVQQEFGRSCASLRPRH